METVEDPIEDDVAQSAMYDNEAAPSRMRIRDEEDDDSEKPRRDSANGEASVTFVFPQGEQGGLVGARHAQRRGCS